MRAKPTEQRTRAVAYVRVSTDRQAAHGVSLDAQRAKLEAYAELYEVAIVATIADAGASAKTLDRDGLHRALALLRAGEADALLVLKLDRLTRSVRDLDTLIQDYFAEGRCALLSVSEQIDTRSAAGRLVLNVLASVSQWEREAIGERTSTAMRHKSARGGFVGGKPPYGYRRTDSGDLAECPTEQAAISVARRLRPTMSLRQVSARLAERGHLARSGRPLTATQVSRMLGESRRTFRGLAQAGG